MNVLADFFERKSRVYLLLVLVPVALYLKGLFYTFSPLDEQWLIVGDTAFLQDWNYLLDAFKDSIQKIYYRPVFMVSLVLDYHTGALNPVVYHISNLIFHVLGTLLLYRLLLLLKTDSKVAAIIGLLFSVHPVLVHAVEWVPGRNDSMLCIFSLLSIIHLIRYFETNKFVHAVLHLLFFVLALLTKENAIVLPLIFIMFFYSYNTFGKKFMLLLITWAAAFATWYYVRNSLITYFPSNTGVLLPDIQEFIGALLIFIGKAVFPVLQSVSPTPANSTIIPGLMAVAALVFLYVKLGVRNKKIAFTGLFMFFILLIIPAWYGVLSPLGEQYEHRIYTSLAGLFIFVSQLNFNTSTRLFNYTVIAFFLFFGIKTFMRIGVYKNDTTYLEEAIADSPDNYMLYATKANIMYERHNIPPALEAYTSAIKLQPNKASLYHNRGNVYHELGKRKEAIEDYTAALRLSNNDPAILLTRCITYVKYKDYEHAMQDLQELKKCCADKLPADFVNDITVKWTALQFSNINAQIAAEPNNAALYIVRARLFFDARKPAETLRDLKKACELEPNNQEYKKYYEQLITSLPR